MVYNILNIEIQFCVFSLKFIVLVLLKTFEIPFDLPVSGVEGFSGSIFLFANRDPVVIPSLLSSFSLNAPSVVCFVMGLGGPSSPFAFGSGLEWNFMNDNPYEDFYKHR